jgi:sugar (pentulose or hexulose) kinase
VQITADVFNLPVKRMRTYETCALGAAINAAVGTGLIKDYDLAVEAMVATGEEFHPHPGHSRIYDELYQDIYLKTFAELAPLYKRGSEITGQ